MIAAELAYFLGHHHADPAIEFSPCNVDLPVVIRETIDVETKATFRLQGDGALTAAQVTERLGIQPTAAAEAGTRVSSRSPHTRDESIWTLSSSPSVESESGVELSEQLDRLLDVLEPVTDTLWDLMAAGYHANWFCFVASHATEHAVELDRPTLQRLLALPGDLWLDVCGDDIDAE